MMEKKKKKRIIKLAVWSVILLAIVAMIANSMVQKANFVPPVKAGAISYQDIDAYLSTTATIASSDSISYFAPPNSKASSVNFKVGDLVRAGDVIATFDLSDLNDQARLAQIGLADAQLALQQAEADMERQPEIDEKNKEIQEYQDLMAGYEYSIQKKQREMGNLGSNSGGGDEFGVYEPSEDELESIARNQNRIANASREIARIQAELSAFPKVEELGRNLLSKKNAVESASINLRALQKYQQDQGIVAELDGIVTQMNLVEGGLSTNTTTALTLETTDNLIASFNISKYDLGVVDVGQDVVLSLGDLIYQGRVSKIGAAAVKQENSSGNAVSAQVPAEVTILNPDEKLVIGLDFDLEIHTFSRPQALAIPVEALLTDREGDFCYRLTPSAEKPGAYTHEKTYIEVGKSSDTYVEVFGGISEGDLVILAPPATLDLMPLVLPDLAAEALPDALPTGTTPEPTDGASSEANPADSSGSDDAAPAPTDTAGSEADPTDSSEPDSAASESPASAE